MKKGNELFNNYYTFYNDSIVLLDPLFIMLNKKIKEGQDINQILEIPSTSFPGKIKPKKSIINHYIRKIEFFNHFYRINSNKINNIYYLKGSDIESKLANLSQITFEVTERCNLNCHYCAYGHLYNNYDDRINSNLDIGVAKTFLDYLFYYLNSNLNISHAKPLFISFYGGEPLMDIIFIKEIINYVKEKTLHHNQLVFSMTTNGILIKKYIKFLSENNIQLLISLDGNKKNNSYRLFKNGTESFDIIYKNLKYIKEKYPEYYQKMINFNSVLHNKNTISEIYNFIKNEFGKIPSISELSSTGINPGRKKEFYKLYQNMNESLLQAEDYQLIKRDMFYKMGESTQIAIFLKQYSGNVFDDYNEFFIESKDLKRLPTGTCIPFSKKIFITTKGKILPCERIGHQFALGEVKSGKVEIDFNLIAKKYNTYFEKINEKCNRCSNFNGCIECIFHIDDIEGKPICRSFTNNAQQLKNLSLNMSILKRDYLLYSKIMNELILHQ